MIQINLLNHNLSTLRRTLKTQFWGAMSSAFFLLLLSVMFAFLSCSPPHPEKKIRGKDITQIFFFKNSGEYKNGANKMVRLYSEENFGKTFYEQTIYFNDTQYALKTDNVFKVFSYSDPNYYNDKKISLKFECSSRLKFKVSRVEEIPKEQIQDNTDYELTAIKSNPIPLKNLIYIDGLDLESHELVRLLEPSKDSLTADELEKLKLALQDQCSKSFNNKYPNETRNTNYGYGNNENYFATTEITDQGFVLLNKDRINSQSNTVYKPDLYSDKSKFLILNEIEFFSAEKMKKTLPLTETNYVQGKLTSHNDFLSGKYSSRTNADTTIEFALNNSDNLLSMTIEATDYSCQKSFRLQTTITSLDLINSKNRAEAIATKTNAANSFYSVYTEADLIFQNSLSKLEMTKPAETAENCSLYKKFEALKNANGLLSFALQYYYSSRSLYILVLDSDLNIIERFNANATDTN